MDKLDEPPSFPHHKDNA